MRRVEGLGGKKQKRKKIQNAGGGAVAIPALSDTCSE